MGGAPPSSIDSVALRSHVVALPTATTLLQDSFQLLMTKTDRVTPCVRPSAQHRTGSNSRCIASCGLGAMTGRKKTHRVKERQVKSGSQ